MDRPVTAPKPDFFKSFDWLDLFPYSIALLMFSGEVYILHQFVTITAALHNY